MSDATDSLQAEEHQALEREQELHEREHEMHQQEQGLIDMERTYTKRAKALVSLLSYVGDQERSLLERADSIGVGARALVEETIEGVDQALVVGHGRPYLGAIITGKIDAKVLKFGIDEMNTNLPHYKRIREYVVADEPFTIENGLLTANQKLRRQAIENHFSPVVDQMYS